MSMKRSYVVIKGSLLTLLMCSLLSKDFTLGVRFPSDFCVFNFLNYRLLRKVQGLVMFELTGSRRIYLKCQEAALTEVL